MPLASGRASVPIPGDAVRLSSVPHTTNVSVAVTAFTDNSDIVVVGSDNVVASVSTRVGHPLAAGKTIVLGDEKTPVQPGSVWVDAVVASEGVTWVSI